MRILFLIFCLLSFNAWSQDPTVYLNSFDAKVYSLKTKGVKDFVVDIESSKLTKQMNEQLIFGKVDEVVFRTYWTANPERIAIEVLGLPEGFKEIKEELKLSLMSILDSLLPPTTMQRFSGYKFHSGATPKEFIAQDSTGIAIIQSYMLQFDNQDRLISVVGKKPIGSLSIVPKYEKESFSDGKWVLKSMTSENSENGQVLIVRKELDYGTSQGIGVLTDLKLVTEQRSQSPGSKPLISEEEFEFKNYKINSGEALKYFLGEPVKPAP